MKHQPTPSVSTPGGGEIADINVQPSSPNVDRDFTATPVTRSKCHACALGKCRHVPSTFTPEEEELIQLTIAAVYEAFEVRPGDGGMPDLHRPVIRRLCRRLCRQSALAGMTEEMIREAQLPFYREAYDAFGNLALFP